MENENVNWKVYAVYVFIMVFVFISSTAFGQIEVKHFNNPDDAKKYKIAVVPTIIIFKDGEEVARFQADLSFKMIATREEVQEEIDNQLMSDF